MNASKGLAQTRKNVLYTYLARGIGLVALVITLPVAAAIGGTSGLGVYTLIASVVTLLNTDAGLGAGSVATITRARLGGDGAGLRTAVANTHTMFLLLATVLSAIYCSIFVLGWDSFSIPADLEEQAVVLAMFGAAQVPFLTMSMSLRQVLTGSGRMDLVGKMLIIHASLRIAGSLAVLALGGSLIALGAIDLAAAIILCLTSAIACRVRTPSARSAWRSVHPSSLLETARLNTPMMVLGLSGLVVMQSGPLVISLTVPIAAVGIWAAGFRLYQLAKEITNSLWTALLPVAVELEASELQGRLKGSRDLYLVGTRHTGALQLALIIPTILLVEQILTLWLGESLASGGQYVAIILLGSLAISNNHLLAIPLHVARGTIGRFATLHVVWAGLSLLLGFVLTPHWGATGMAIAVAAPIALLEPWYVRHTLHVIDGSWEEFARVALLPLLAPTIASASIGLIVLQMLDDSWPGFVAVALASALGYLVTYLFAAQSKAEREQLREIVGLGAKP